MAAAVLAAMCANYGDDCWRACCSKRSAARTIAFACARRTLVRNVCSRSRWSSTVARRDFAASKTRSAYSSSTFAKAHHPGEAHAGAVAIAAARAVAFNVQTSGHRRRCSGRSSDRRTGAIKCSMRLRKPSPRLDQVVSPDLQRPLYSG
jgi:hypothetical protein